MYGLGVEVRFLFYLVYTFEQGQWVTCSQNQSWWEKQTLKLNTNAPNCTFVNKYILLCGFVINMEKQSK